MRVWVVSLCVIALSCGDDTAPAPAPTTILAAYVLDSAQLGCDLGDPRSWGGNFEVLDQRGNPLYLRCVPDLLNPLDQLRTPKYSYDVQVRLVFSQPLALNDLAGAVSLVTSAGATVPLAPTSSYDPAGADFKQGKDGTAPPGPAFALAPGNGSDLVGLPSGTKTTVCVSDSVVDSLGRPLAEPRCVDVQTLDFCLGATQTDAPPFTITHLRNGLTLVLTAPMHADVLSDPANYEVAFGSAIDPSCFAVRPGTTPTALVLTLSDTPPCTIPTPPTMMKWTIKDSLTDQYGAPFCGSVLFIPIPGP